MRGIAARSITLLVLAALAFAAAASTGAGASPARIPILGVVPHAGGPAPTPRAAAKAAVQAAEPTSLTFDASYESLLNRYFADVAHDSGGSSNVYAVAKQYSDGSGHIQYSSTVGGSYVDRDPLPPNGCTDGGDPYCLTDQQLENEIQAVLTARGWHGGLDHIFFLLTPNGVGSCFDTLGSQCSTNVFCAYHSAFLDSNDEDVIYANEPYEGPTAGAASGCTGPDQGFPNDTDADTTINTISHEHNEAITDPFGDGWIANDGNEDGDLCAYGFGSSDRWDGGGRRVQPGDRRPPLRAAAGVEQLAQRLHPEARGSIVTCDLRQRAARLPQRVRDAHERDVRDLLAPHGRKHEPAGRHRQGHREPHPRDLARLVERSADRLLVPMAALLLDRDGLRRHRGRHGRHLQAHEQRRWPHRALDGARDQRERPIGIRPLGDDRDRCRRRCPDPPDVATHLGPGASR